MTQIRWGDSEEQWQQIATEWSVGVGHVVTELSQKWAFWKKLPWRLCALAHPQEHIAREHAAGCMDVYDRSVAVAGHASRRRLAQKFLHPDGALRPLLDKWLDGTPLRDLPLLAFEIAKLANIPIVERDVSSQACLEE